jgi:zinc protease
MKKMLLLFAGALFIVTGFSQTKLVEKVVKKGTEIVIPYEKYYCPMGLRW